MKRFGLVDCHCFYVSAERLFRPELLGKPVVALSMTAVPYLEATKPKPLA
jgi:nucleotidyltransferase/DNA polymerase involved in DNA repair